ncbi:MAG: hypothetical protein KGK08_00205 [Acidobacteriota bacterium]|nr:hypothetical protein [Acidobacteriota bacterium]
MLDERYLAGIAVLLGDLAASIAGWWGWQRAPGGPLYAGLAGDLGLQMGLFVVVWIFVLGGLRVTFGPNVWRRRQSFSTKMTALAQAAALGLVIDLAVATFLAGEADAASAHPAGLVRMLAVRAAVYLVTCGGVVAAGQRERGSR